MVPSLSYLLAASISLTASFSASFKLFSFSSTVLLSASIFSCSFCFLASPSLCFLILSCFLTPQPSLSQFVSSTLHGQISQPLSHLRDREILLPLSLLSDQQWLFSPRRLPSLVTMHAFRESLLSDSAFIWASIRPAFWLLTDWHKNLYSLYTMNQKIEKIGGVHKRNRNDSQK